MYVMTSRASSQWDLFDRSFQCVPLQSTSEDEVKSISQAPPKLLRSGSIDELFIVHRFGVHAVQFPAIPIITAYHCFSTIVQNSLSSSLCFYFRIAAGADASGLSDLPPPSSQYVLSCGEGTDSAAVGRTIIRLGPRRVLFWFGVDAVRSLSVAPSSLPPS